MDRYQVDGLRLAGVSLLPLEEGPAGCFLERLRNPFLGRFDESHLLHDLHEVGILDEVARRGYGNLALAIEASAGRSSLTLRSDNDVLMELIVWREFARIQMPWMAEPTEPLPSIAVEWLSLTDPRADIDPEIQSPGQLAPGLGVSLRILRLLRGWAVRCGAALLFELPEYFHTACMFARAFRYLDPEMQGLFDAASRDLPPRLVPPAATRPRPDRSSGWYPHSWLHDQGDPLLTWAPADLARVSRAFEAGDVRRNGSVFMWPTEAQVFPESNRVLELMRDPRWHELRARAARENTFTLASS